MYTSFIEVWPIVNQVLELDSRNVKALYRRAQAYIQLVDLELAEIDIKMALEIDPDNRYCFLGMNFNNLISRFLTFINVRNRNDWILISH